MVSEMGKCGSKGYMEGGPVPSEKEFEAMSPKDKDARKKKAMMQNLNLSPEEKAAKKAMMKKPAKKMMAGGMAKAYKDGGEVEKKDKKAEKLEKNKEQAYKQSKKIYEAEESLPKGSIRRKIAEATDKVGDKVRGSSVGKLAKKMGTGTFSRDDEAQMKARKEVKGYKKGGKIRGYGMARGGKVVKSS